MILGITVSSFMVILISILVTKANLELKIKPEDDYWITLVKGKYAKLTYDQRIGTFLFQSSCGSQKRHFTDYSKALSFFSDYESKMAFHYRLQEENLPVDPLAKHFSVLGLKRDASQEQIRTAYLSLAKVHHPDKGGSKEEFSKISNAYVNLSK